MKAGGDLMFVVPDLPRYVSLLWEQSFLEVQLPNSSLPFWGSVLWVGSQKKLLQWCREITAEKRLCCGLLALTSQESGSILFLTCGDVCFANSQHVTGWLWLKNLPIFMQQDTIRFRAVVSQRTLLLCRGKGKETLDCSMVGTVSQASDEDLGWPGGSGLGSGQSLSLRLKTKDSDAALFLSQGSALSFFISPKMCSFTSIPSTNILVNFMQSLSFYFVGMWTLLQGSFCSIMLLFILRFVFLFVSKYFFFVSVWSAHFGGRSWLLHGIKAYERFLSKNFLGITILIITFHRHFETPAFFNSYSTKTWRRYTWILAIIKIVLSL